MQSTFSKLFLLLLQFFILTGLNSVLIAQELPCSKKPMADVDKVVGSALKAYPEGERELVHHPDGKLSLEVGNVTLHYADEAALSEESEKERQRIELFQRLLNGRTKLSFKTSTETPMYLQWAYHYRFPAGQVPDRKPIKEMDLAYGPQEEAAPQWMPLVHVRLFRIVEAEEGLRVSGTMEEAGNKIEDSLTMENMNLAKLLANSIDSLERSFSGVHPSILTESSNELRYQTKMERVGEQIYIVTSTLTVVLADGETKKTLQTETTLNFSQPQVFAEEVNKLDGVPYSITTTTQAD